MKQRADSPQCYAIAPELYEVGLMLPLRRSIQGVQLDLAIF